MTASLLRKSMNNQRERQKNISMADKIVQQIDLIDHIKSISDIELAVITPLRQKLPFKAKYIGVDEKQHIFFTLPAISKANLDKYFLDGFKIIAQGISHVGKAQMLEFDSTICHVITKPIQLLVLNIPYQGKLSKIRDEVRYQMQIEAIIQLAKRKLDVILSDLSSSGFGFRFDALSPELEMNKTIELEINAPNGEFFVLSGQIKNRKQKRNRQYYGVVFDDFGKENCKRLFATLTYDGANYVFKTS